MLRRNNPLPAKVPLVKIPMKVVLSWGPGTAVKMGSRWKPGAVPATVSGELAIRKGCRSDRAVSQETCLRRRPHPAGISQGCVAPRERLLRGDMNVSFQEDRMNILYFISTLALQPADAP